MVLTTLFQMTLYIGHLAVDKYMQEENNNTKKIVIIGAIVVILLAIFAYVLIFKNTAPATNNTSNTTENKPLFPELSFNNIFGGEEDVVTSDTDLNQADVAANNVFKVWGGETLGANVLDDGSIMFVDKKTGELKRSVYPYDTSESIDNTSTNCFDAKVSETGKRALLSCSDGFYVWGDSRFTFVDRAVFDFDFIGSTDDYVYMSGTQNGFVLYQNKLGKVTALGDMSLRDVTILKTDNNYVYISEKQNGRSQKLFVYSFKNKDFYYVGDLATQNISPFQQNYTKEKCFTYDVDFNFCFGRFFDSFDLVAWRKGLITLSDQAFAYHFPESEYIGVGTLSTTIDTVKTGHNATSGDAYMIDKNTSNLFIVNMAQFVEATNDHDH